MLEGERRIRVEGLNMVGGVRSSITGMAGE